MKKVHEGSFRVLTKWLQWIQAALVEQGVPHKPGDSGPVDMIDKAIGALYRNLKREPLSTNVPVSTHFQVNQTWIDLALRDLYQFNSMGDEYICSTVEAVIKCSGIKQAIDQYEEALFYRGEHNFGWELISRLGRKLHIDWDATDPCQVTVEEKRLLSEFQSRCASDSTINSVVFGNSVPLPMHHPGWWSLMQHYDEANGTRMIDVTSSLFCALFFACVNWDGTVDSSIDGKLYMFPYQPGRGEILSPKRFREHLIDDEDEDEKQYTIDDYFNVEAHPNTPRFRVSPARNDRALSQDGFFVWQSFFDRPLKTYQIFPFRIHREYKHSIL